MVYMKKKHLLLKITVRWCGGCLGNNKLKVEKHMNYEIPKAAHLFDRPTVRLKMYVYALLKY